jgi:hypothetical protein
MNTINVFLEASGQIADLQKDFPLYVGQYQNVKIDIFIPSEIMADSFIYQSKTTNNAIISDNSAYTAVKIAMSYIKRTGTIAQSTNYYVQFLNTQTINNIKYYVYERYLPTTFTLFSGTGEQSPKLTINVVNELSTTTTSNGTTTTNVSLLSRITSQTCALEVLPSNDLTSDPTTDPSELEILSGSVNSLLALMPTKSDRDATVLKYDVADFSSTGTPPLDINYTKDGFKTYGVLFKNETFSVPTIQGDTSNQTGSIIVIAFRQSGTTGYQDEMFFNANGINIRTITFNLSATPYEVTNVGEWVAYNTEYMQGLINEHNTSSTAHQDIRNLIMNNTTNISYLQTNKVNKGEGYRNETTGTFDNGVIFNILDSGNDTITLKKYNHDRPTETTNNDNTNSIVLSNSSITLTAQNDTNGTTTTNTIIITSTSFNLNGDPIVSKTYIDNADNLLRNEIENLGALTYKGSVATYGDLPTNAKTGDMYNVVAPYGEYSANSNYAWNGTEWDNLGGQVDLSAYSTTTQLTNGEVIVGKAYQDSLGNVIAETYVPKTKIIDTIDTTLTNTDETYSVNAINPKIVEVEQNNTDIGSIINGAITVGKSTKATQDQNGNIINETYATKTELSETAPLNVASVSSTAPYSANYTNNNFASISISNQYYLTKSADTTGTFSLTKSNVADTNYLTTTTTNTTLDFTSATKLTLTLPLANSTLNPNELLTITLATAFNRNNNTEYGVQVFNGSTQIASNQAFGYLSQQGNASYSVVSLITLPIRLDLLTAPTEINGNLVIYIYKAQKKADSLITRYYTGALVNGANRYSYLDYSLNPITSTDFTKTEEFTISTTEWSSLTPALSDSPYNYQATITAVNNIMNASIGTIVDDLNLYSVYAFAVGSVSGQTITIWSVGQPSYNVAITIKESY